MSVLTIENYHADTKYISKSGLDKINISPAHYYYYYLDPKRPDFDDNETPDQFLGTVFHCILMEPQHFIKRYMVVPAKTDRRTREGKELWFKYLTKAKGKRLVKHEIYTKAMAMRRSVRRHPIAKKLFLHGTAEEIYKFKEPMTGVECKFRLDWRTPDNIIVDLKSAIDASCVISNETEEPETINLFSGFPKSVFQRRYDVQDSFYSDGFEYATGRSAKAFIFVAVEKEPPFEVSLYTLSEEIKDAARDKYLSNLETLKQCRATNIWPGYDNRIITIKNFEE